ncbi:transcriptional regulator [Flavobacterium rivuli WB 3.3-2 = DSM 21788]|uniref:Transcriptional regulator n=1 Tax=Flavobacterium rivuli WB 3.3-2 = DSM 21788 TaxID=1121895 RepID=A0A0A2M5D1_9FLAO|nr:GyrI-like domain-containing protein [Flavobacterium rivuli]KGO87862.1 transcriptional regulator [Flavobacterium rivuli WB 3.3-2 = DSM 21788]
MTPKENFKLTGLKLDKKTFNAIGQAAIDCGALWQKFMGEAVADKITDKLSTDIYAVYFEYEGDHTQPYSFFIGCIVDADTETPNGLQSIEIPNQKYAIVTAKGKMPECVANAWQEIWKSDVDRVYGYDFEVYNELSADWENAIVDIYLSVK